jgi:cell division protein YceG involved in septum cleavage
MARFKAPFSSLFKLRLRTYFITAIFGSCALLSVFIFVGASILTYETAQIEPEAKGPSPFPLGVDPTLQLITEHENVDTFFDTEEVPPSLATWNKNSWFSLALAKLAQLSVLQNLASPSGRLLVILPGERREEVAERFGKLLDWTPTERQYFLELVASSTPELTEGKYTPSKYLTARDATPEDAAKLVIDRFDEEIASRYTPEIAAIVPLEDALTIASLLEREAYDFNDMRYISGIIWNRLFAGMKLQLDATLQYAKGSKPSQRAWWPRVVPSDKYIASAYNTYENEGLPPAPIANPSIDAILAALNPRKTDCMFYFHDSEGGFHCSKTYEEHVARLKEHYGRGK